MTSFTTASTNLLPFLGGSVIGAIWEMMVVGAPDVDTQDPWFHVSKALEFFHTNIIFA